MAKRRLSFNLKENKNRIKQFKKRYKINSNKINILYAPSFECFDRQIEVAKVVKKLGFNLIIKHWLEKKEKNTKIFGTTLKGQIKKLLRFIKRKQLLFNQVKIF